MSKGKSLLEIVEAERLDAESPEMAAIISSREDIEKLIRRQFGFKNLSIRYGGSKAKGTILKCEHDADLLVYFDRDNNVAGDTLSAIYHSIGNLLGTEYFASPGTTSWRVHARGAPNRKDLKVDVVPGRFIDGQDGDVFLHQKDGDKDYMMTNPEKHIAHVKDSGVVEAVCVLKLWRIKNAVQVKQFPFELMCIDLLADLKRRSLDDQVAIVLERVASMDSAPRVIDPANKSNDVSKALKLAWADIQQEASSSVERLDNGWEDVLGLPTEAASDEKLYAMAASVRTPTKPWSN